MPEQLEELIDREAGVGDDATKRARPDLFVIGNYNPRVWLLATQHHVAAGLTTKDEAGAFEGGADFSARQIGGELGHVAAASRFRLGRVDLNEFLADLSRNRISGGATVLNIKLDGFADIAQRFCASVALAYTSWQRRHAHHVSAVLFLLQHDGIAH